MPQALKDLIVVVTGGESLTMRRVTERLRKEGASVFACPAEDSGAIFASLAKNGLDVHVPDAVVAMSSRPQEGSLATAIQRPQAFVPLLAKKPRTSYVLVCEPAAGTSRDVATAVATCEMNLALSLSMRTAGNPAVRHLSLSIGTGLDDAREDYLTTDNFCDALVLLLSSPELAKGEVQIGHDWRRKLDVASGGDEYTSYL